MNVKDLKLRTVKAYKLVIKVGREWVMVSLTYARDLWEAWDRVRTRFGYGGSVVPVPVEG